MEKIPGLTDRAAEGIANASAYFSTLVSQGVAPIIINDTRGEIIVDVTIEGLRFQAFADKDPYVTSKDRGDWCQLGVASIHLTNRWGRSDETERWMVCKYSASEGRIDLSPLSDAGRRAFAVTFGVPIGNCHELGFNESYGFYASNALDGLVAWAKRRPRKFKLESGVSSYIGDWKSIVSACIDRDNG